MSKFFSAPNLTLHEVLAKFHSGPQSGVFTDGCCQPNPGPGGWGVVWVKNGSLLTRRHGCEQDTTNNRMELSALIEAYKLLPADAEETIYSDSNLCVSTVNEWAAQWESRGWKRKTGAIANLELVKELYALAKTHPQVTLKWIRAHDGSLWNEYADSLANAWARDKL